MEQLSNEDAKKVLDVISDLLEDKISYSEFLDKIPFKDNPDVDELIDMITHEPSERGFFGVDRKKIAKEYRDGMYDSLREFAEKYKVSQ